MSSTNILLLLNLLFMLYKYLYIIATFKKLEKDFMLLELLLKNEN